ncbi:YadA-like family protein [Mannheimia sp. HC-2023]|uniref:YadA-like family protein n=1 Tax=Mannheimia indoligenes TaxID=3103145 RepID=UPI002FE53E2E
MAYSVYGDYDTTVRDPDDKLIITRYQVNYTREQVDKKSIAIGSSEENRAKATSGSVAIGNKANAGEGSVSVGSYSDAQKWAVAIGYHAKAIDGAKLAIGNGAEAKNANSVAVGGSQALGRESVAVGVLAHVAENTERGTAVGTEAIVQADNGTAMGVGAIVNEGANNAIAIGYLVNATLQDSVALGSFTNTTGELTDNTAGKTEYSKVELGDLAFNFAGGKPTSVVSIGDVDAERRLQNVAAGLIAEKSTDAINGSQLYAVISILNKENYFHVNTGDATQPAGDATTNKGTVDAKGGASAKNALAAGVNAKAKGENAIAIGLDSTAEKLSSIAIGKKSNAVGSESVAVGLEAKSDGWRTVAIGYQAETTVESANAIGNQAKATNWGATALGTIAKASGTNSSALGNNAHANGAFGTAVGTSSVASGAYSTALGTLSNAVAYGTIGTGLHSYAGKKDAIATGSYSVASGLSSIATGAKAGAYGNLSMAMGSDAKADDDQSIAVGANSRAISAYSMAMGSNALTMAEGALALGRDAFVGSSLELEEATLDYFTKLDEYYSNERVLAHTSPSASTYNDLKAKSTTLAAELAVLKEKYTQAASASETENAVAIGAYSQAMHKEAVALGSYSTTEAPVAAIPATVNGITYSDFAGNNPLATVSVGSKDKERKIINVAAGRIAKDSTDAINGSQLYLTQHALGNVGNSVVTNFGGNAKMNQDGNMTFTNIGGTGKNTIHEAIQFATTAVKSGKNTKVDQTPKKNEYTINAWDTTVSAQNNSGLTLTPTIDVTNMTRAYALSINTDNETIKVENGTLVVKKEAIDSNTITEVAQGDNIVVSGGNEVNGKRVYTVAVAKDVDLNTIKVNKALNVGNVTINQAGINAGNQKVTGVADGDISAQSKDAVNGSQLHKVINDFNTNVAASKIEVKAGTNVTSVTSTAGGNGQSVYTVNADGASVSAGSDAITVAKGVKDANNVTNYSVDLAEKTKADVQKGVDAHTTVTNKGLTFAGDSGSTEAKKLGSTVKVKGDRNITTLASSDTVNVKLNEDISVKSVKAGNTLVNNDGVTVHNKATGKSVRLTSNGLNNGGHRVTHIADGREDTDAVNVRQLKQVDNNVRHLDAKVNRVDHKLRAGIAQAGAMANIPQVTRSGASGVGVGVANYRGESAVSVGYSRLSDNGKHIIKGSVSVDSSGFGMAGAGYMYQW